MGADGHARLVAEIGQRGVRFMQRPRSVYILSRVQFLKSIASKLKGYPNEAEISTYA